MKLSTKSAAALIALLAASTVGGSVVSAATKGEEAVTDGKVQVGDATDTKDDKVHTLDPETKGYLVNPGEGQMFVQGQEGPMKIERAPHFQFGKIEPQANDIIKSAATFDYQKKDTNKADETPKEERVTRGAIIQFADVRNDKFGYNITASMSQQFKADDKFLTGSTITLNNGILKAEEGNGNKTPELIKDMDVVLKAGDENTSGPAIKILQAGADQGKGRFAIEYGQSDKFDPADPAAGKGAAGLNNSAKDAVKLFVPNSTASNMAKGDYVAKITWTIGATE